jgi:hypothetical protein
MDEEGEDSARSDAPALAAIDDREDDVADAIDDTDDDAESAAAGSDEDDRDDELAAAGPETKGEGAARLIAARFSPHSTQKRAPTTTGAPHCGQNRTALCSGQ